MYIRLFRFVTVHAFDRQTDRKATAIAVSNNRVRCALKQIKPERVTLKEEVGCTISAR